MTLFLPLLAAAAVAATAPTPAAPPPQLWRDARVGMTLEQVEEMFPKGFAAGGLPGWGGAVPQWGMAEQVYGYAGAATFYFLNGRLSQVIVSLPQVKTGTTDDNLAAARELARDLSGYYGKPATCVDALKKGLDRVDCRWSAPGLEAAMSYVDYAGQSARLNVTVHAPTAKKPTTGAVFKTKGRRM